jgi:hypothetical protein
MRGRARAGSVVDLLAREPERHFPDQATWAAHIERLGITALTVAPGPVCPATEDALWSVIKGPKVRSVTDSENVPPEILESALSERHTSR